MAMVSDSPESIRPPDAGTSRHDTTPVTAMCECAHHWNFHAESNLTAQTAICHGYTGSATPGPLREPCRCTGFAQWTGPRDSRTGEPVKPLTLTIDARVQPPVRDLPDAVTAEARIAAEEAFAAAHSEHRTLAYCLSKALAAAAPLLTAAAAAAEREACLKIAVEQWTAAEVADLIRARGGGAA